MPCPSTHLQVSTSPQSTIDAAEIGKSTRFKLDSSLGIIQRRLESPEKVRDYAVQFQEIDDLADAGELAVSKLLKKTIHLRYTGSVCFGSRLPSFSLMNAWLDAEDVDTVVQGPSIDGSDNYTREFLAGDDCATRWQILLGRKARS